MTKLKENLIVFIATLFLTGAVIIFVNSSTNNLATDVLGTKENQKENNQDVQIVLDEEKASMIMKKDVENIYSVSIEIMFDSSQIELARSDFNSSFELSYMEKEGGNGCNIILGGINALESQDTLFDINNITKEQFDNINVGHIQIMDNMGNIMELTSLKN